MINLVKEYLAARKFRADVNAFRAGFGWAMTAYFCEQMHIDAILDASWPNNDSFDCGARQAISELVRIQKDRHDLRIALSDLRLIISAQAG